MGLRGKAVKMTVSIVLALILGMGLGYFGPRFVFAAGQTELTFPAPDLDPKAINPTRPGQSFACDPLADANVFDNKLTHKATIWAGQDASKIAIQISDDGKRLSFMKASDVLAGMAQPEVFNITFNGNSYMQAEERLPLGVAFLIFDTRTMKMVWSFNGQGVLGIKGESVLFQCR